MASTNIEFRVGSVIVIGALILASSLYWLQGYKLERNNQAVSIRFDDVGTLSSGDKVTVSGVRKGRVDDLQLTAKGVLVRVLLYQDVVLHSDARFVIRNQGLMGERFIAIWPGEEPDTLDFNTIVPGEYDLGLPDVMGKLGDMVNELRNLVHVIRRTIGSDSMMVQINETIGNLGRVSSSLANYIDRNEGKLDATADNFYQAARTLNKMMAENSVRVDSSLIRFDRTTGRLDHFAAQLDTLSLAAREFADKLNNPDGTVQLLLEDRRLYDDLRVTADNIDDLVNDIRANPRKYINLKVEIF